MATTATAPAKPEKKSGWILFLRICIVIAILIVIATAVEQHEINKERLRPRFTPKVVDTLSFTLRPRDRVVFSTEDPVTGQLCQYVATWKKFSRDSSLINSTHNHLGANGVGGKKLSSYLTPWRQNNFLGGDSKNKDTYYVCVQNNGPDTVEFSVELIGYRQVANQISLEKE